MNAKRALQWSGYYVLLSGVFTVVGLAMAGVGGYLTYESYQVTGAVTAALGDSIGAVVLAVVGVLVWRFGHAWAFYKTLTGAVEEELSTTYDTEHVKSDILSVLDDRLADMQLEMQTMKGTIKDLAREQDADGGFQFDD